MEEIKYGDYKPICVEDPTRMFVLTPTILEAEDKPLKWYQKVYYFFWEILHSNAYLWTMIILGRCLQAICIGILVWWFVTYCR